MLRLILVLPFLVVLFAFVFYNQTPATLELPTVSWQSSTGVVVLIASAIFFLLGALVVWFAELKQRRRARRAEAQNKQLETQISELRAQLGHSYAQNMAYQSAGVPVAPTALPHPTGTYPVAHPDGSVTP